MQAGDIMSSSVISVDPDTPVVQVAAILRERRIGGVPVVAAGRLVGIVTGTDLLHRREIGTHRAYGAQAWWRRLIWRRAEPARYVKSHGRRARDVMTRDVLVVRPTTSLAGVTALFESHGIGRAPVVSGDVMVGIVTCADLVRALSVRPPTPAPCGTPADDAAVREALLAELRLQPWWNGSISTVVVEGGVVAFHGFVDGDGARRASHVAAENVAGVHKVTDDRRPLSELPSML